MKRCRGYDRDEHHLLPDGFYKDASRTDGLTALCKDCLR